MSKFTCNFNYKCNEFGKNLAQWLVWCLLFNSISTQNNYCRRNIDIMNINDSQKRQIVIIRPRVIYIDLELSHLWVVKGFLRVIWRGNWRRRFPPATSVFGKNFEGLRLIDFSKTRLKGGWRFVMHNFELMFLVRLSQTFEFQFSSSLLDVDSSVFHSTGANNKVIWLGCKWWHPCRLREINC